MKKNIHYIIQDASCSLPLTRWGSYRHVAVLQVDVHLERVSMISLRAKGVHEIVWDSGSRCATGRRTRASFCHACTVAQRMCDVLNQQLEEQKNG